LAFAHERCTKAPPRLIGSEHVDRAAQALQPELLALDRERQVEDRSRILLVARHRFQAQLSPADWLHHVVLALGEAVLEEDLFRLQRIRRVGRVDHDDAASQVRESADVGLDEKFIHAAVAAGDDDHVLSRHLDHRDRVVDRRDRDVDGPGGEAFALPDRVLGERKLERDVVPGEDALRDSGMQRQGLRVRKRIDAQALRLGPHRRQWMKLEKKTSENGEQAGHESQGTRIGPC
jgi:hypothetical protein